MSAQWLLDLYDRSHGVPHDRIAWAHLGDSPEDRRRVWADTWNALGWTRGEPRGSSRLLELAMGQAVHDGELVVALREAFDALGQADGPLRHGTEWQVRLLWTALLPTETRHPEAWRFWGALPERITPAQALLVAAFLGPHATKTERAQVRAVLAGETLALGWGLEDDP